MSRSKIIFLLLICVAAAQTFTAVRPSWLPVYLHAPRTPLRPLLMVGMAAGLLALLLRRGEGLSRSECLALLIGTAGGLANLTDILRLGAVVDFIPLAPEALASPGDFLIASGFLGCIPLTLYHARKGHGLYGLYRHWRAGAQVRILDRVTS
jgi:hypothetical protein